MPTAPETEKVNEKKIDEEDEEEDTDEEDEKPTLKKQFVSFVKYRDENNPGTHILLSQSDFWMKHAGLIKEFLQNLANYKNIPLEVIIEKLVACGPPQVETNVNVGLGR